MVFVFGAFLLPPLVSLCGWFSLSFFPFFSLFLLLLPFMFSFFFLLLIFVLAMFVCDNLPRGFCINLKGGLSFLSCRFRLMRGMMR